MTQTDATPKSQRRRRASVGGFKQKLDAPKREGFIRRFVLDDPARIIEMQELGYDFVTEKAGAGSSRTDGQGTRITRHAGRNAEGKPHQHVLMETPIEEYQRGVDEKEEHLSRFEQAIRAGRDTTGQMTTSEAYDTKASSISHSTR